MVQRASSAKMYEAFCQGGEHHQYLAEQPVLYALTNK